MDGSAHVWVQRLNGDVWTDDGPKARPVAYKVGHGWMIAGIRSIAELHQIINLLENGHEPKVVSG